MILSWNYIDKTDWHRSHFAFLPYTTSFKNVVVWFGFVEKRLLTNCSANIYITRPSGMKVDTADLPNDHPGKT